MPDAYNKPESESLSHGKSSIADGESQSDFEHDDEGLSFDVSYLLNLLRQLVQEPCSDESPAHFEAKIIDVRLAFFCFINYCRPYPFMYRLHVLSGI
jgi:hypothetical protein